MRYLTNALFLAGGALIGFGASVTWAEKNAQKRYEESEVYRANSMALAEQFAQSRTEAPVAQPPDVEVLNPIIATTNVASGVVTYPEVLDVVNAPVDLGDAPEKIELISPEEYEEEDAYEKHQVSAIVTEDGPLVLLDQQEIDDVDDRLGRGLVEMLVGQMNEDPVYVRHNLLMEDYEIFVEMP